MTALIVPIALDVLMVRTATVADDWADTAMREPQAQAGRRVRQQLEADPFASRAGPRDPGAYLHWALPDALAQGKSTASGLELPVVPDRWLVVRLTDDAATGKRKVDAWLIPDATAATPQVIPQALSIAAPAGGVPASAGEMTVLGPGSFTWAACYDNVEGRFALFDDLAGVSGAVAYGIYGWYSDKMRDPVFTATESAFLDRMEDLDWSLARPLRSGEGFPDQCLFHAAALGLGWPLAAWDAAGTIGVEPDMRPDPALIDIALGETLAEAVVAAAADDLDALSASLLEAHLTGVLGDPGGVDAVASLDAGLNMARFASEPGETSSETIWQGNADDPLSGSFRGVERAGPRLWQAVNPAIVLQGGGRSARHGGDGRFGEEDDLVCRLDGDLVTGFGVVGGDPGTGVDMVPATGLSGLPDAYGAPRALNAMLTELASIDPGSAPDIATAAAAGGNSAVATARARWWDAFADGADEVVALQGAAITGVLPSPISIFTPRCPWNPVHLDWEVAYLPSPHGAHDWVLGDADFTLPAAIALPALADELTFTGHATLNPGAARMLESLMEDRDSMAAPLFDLVGGSLEGFVAQLRGDRPLAVVAGQHGTLDDPMAQGARPPDFQALRAGFLRMERLRLVDGFGRYLDIDATGHAVGRTLVTPGHPGLAALRPRFTAPAQILLTFTDAAGSGARANEGLTPICGYILPATNDTSMELFDADGAGLGRLRLDEQSGTAWEAGPGRDAALGARPQSHVGNAVLAGLAEGVFGIDAIDGTAPPAIGPSPTALSSLLRIVDAARWSTDITGPAGEEHLSLMLGQPVAVVRATVRLDVLDERKPPENATTAIPVRLGSLAQSADGLLGYFIDDDYTRLRVADPEVAEIARKLESDPLLESYLDTSGLFYINPGIDVALTLLMVPGSSVQATTGVLPQKQVSLLREWTSPALSRLSPTLRFGPVLRDYPTTRLPVATDIRGDWLWHRRPDPLTWLSDVVVPTNTSAQLPDTRLQASGGWLQVKLLPDLPYAEGRIGTRIRYVNKGRGGVITDIGGKNPDDTVFTMPVGQAIRLQESGRFYFFVQRDGASHQTDLQIVTRRSGRKYMRSKADRSDSNNLDNLPPVPV